MFELVIAVTEANTHLLELCLKIGDLFFEGVNFALGFGSVADFKRIDFLGEHEHTILGHVFSWVILEVRE